MSNHLLSNLSTKKEQKSFFLSAVNQKWLILLLIIVIILGIFFRLNNIDLKPYWHDEIYTSLRISGRTGDEAIKEFSGRIISHQDILKYQCPSAEKNLADTIRVLAHDDPQHPPLFYGLEAIWSRLFGCSVTTTRSLSVLFSLFLLPTIYLICQELFNKPLVTWIATALVSVSPIQIRYAQEARQYSLLAFLTALSGLILIKAVKNNTFSSWATYAIAVSGLLYCHLLSILVLTGHLIFVIVVNFTRKIKILRNYISALSVGFITFLPWAKILIIGKNTAEQKTSWLSQNIDFLSLIEKWSLNLNRIFISWNYEFNSWSIYLSIPFWLITLYSFYFILKKNHYSLWVFVFSLTGTTVVTLIVIDILRTGKSSTLPNYLLPSFLGIQICVAYLLGTKLNYPFSTEKQRQFWSIVTVAIFSGSIISNAIDLQAETWWNWSKFDVEAAKIVNTYSHPLVISEGSLGEIAPLTYLLNSEAKIMLLDNKRLENLPNFENIFLYQVSEELTSQIAENKQIKVNTIYRFQEDSFIVPLFKIQK